MRGTLFQTGRKKLLKSKCLSSKRLNIHNVSRQGTKTAITDKQVEAVINKAIETNYYLEEGFTEIEALAMTSMDLGHGDGRGHYIKNVYGKTGEEDE